MRRLWFVIWIAASSGIALGQGTVNYTVFPLGFSNQNADGRDVVLNGPATRQQIWSGQYLAQAWDAPVLLNEIAFRVDSGVLGLNAVIPFVEVRLGSTERAPSDITGNWFLNSGPDRRTVFLHENVIVNSSGGPGPNPFEARFAFETPFYYDPQAGNLSIYVMTSGDPSGFEGGAYIDAHSNVPEAAIIGLPNFPNAYPGALVTRFGWTSVPEPGVMALLKLAVIAAACKRWRAGCT